MSTSTTSDPLPVPALPAHHATPIQTGFAGPLPAIERAQREELARLEGQTGAGAGAGMSGETAAKESAVDLRGFAAGTASGLTKLVVGKCKLSRTERKAKADSALTRMLAGHPFDVIKVRLQCSPRGTYAGPWDCLKRTVQSEGPRALYKGEYNEPCRSYAGRVIKAVSDGSER